MPRNYLWWLGCLTTAAVLFSNQLKKKKAIMKRRYHRGPWPSLGLFPTQDTLAYATALLNEKDQSGSSNGSESSPANENGERHLQQVTRKKQALLLAVRQLVLGARVRSTAEWGQIIARLPKLTCHIFPLPILCVLKGLRISHDDWWA